jgi:hypothetical protein
MKSVVKKKNQNLYNQKKIEASILKEQESKILKEDPNKSNNNLITKDDQVYITGIVDESLATLKEKDARNLIHLIENSL